MVEKFDCPIHGTSCDGSELKSLEDQLSSNSDDKELGLAGAAELVIGALMRNEEMFAAGYRKVGHSEAANEAGVFMLLDIVEATIQALYPEATPVELGAKFIEFMHDKHSGDGNPPPTR